jgi:hypothetical protein
MVTGSKMRGSSRGMGACIEKGCLRFENGNWGFGMDDNGQKLLKTVQNCCYSLKTRIVACKRVVAVEYKHW